MKTIGGFLPGLGVLLLASTGGTDTRVPTIDDMVALKRVSQPALSPDGSRVAYVVRKANWEENAFENEIWLADVRTGKTIAFAFGQKSSDAPTFSPDGSSLAYIKGAKAPTLIQHGDADQRVPVSNAFELYQGLRDQGVETRLALYKGFGHSLNKPKALRHAMRENLDWFDKHLFGSAGAK